jgi:adenylate kinase
MSIALTGTPGTGKSSCAKLLAKRGHSVASLNDAIRRKKLGKKDRDGCVVVDAKALRGLKLDADIIEGHLSHILPVDIVIVLRCDPRVLEKRLKRKRYKAKKVRENMEAEALDAIVIEALEEGMEPYEIDTTGMSPEDVADAVERIIKGKGDGFKKHIDFSEVVLEWY